MKSITLCLLLAATLTAEAPPAGFTSLFNGADLKGWKIPDGDGGHWKIVNGVIDYDAASEAPKDKNLWSEKTYRDFVIRVDWRIKATPYRNKNARIVMPDGNDKVDENGKVITIDVPDSDSGILLRGTGRAQVNIWCWPVGSGEFYGYRTDKKMPPEVRAGVTPKFNADKNIGEWNTFEITVRGERATVVLNGVKVVDNAHLPGLPAEGPIGLQHHGRVQDGKYLGPPSLMQFRNIFIKEL
ncbi:MAG: 3-keto-disaccharide hydrolase [Bryobacteraceae bacterium]